MAWGLRMTDREGGASGRGLARRGLVVIAAIALLLLVSGTRVAAEEPLTEPSPSPTDETGPDPTATSPVTSGVESPSATVEATSTPTSGDEASAVAAETTPTPLPGDAPSVVSETSSPASSDETTVLTAATTRAGPLDGPDPGAEVVAPPLGTDDPASVVASPAAAALVERALSAYVDAVVRAAVVDVEGEVAACFCALAVSVSLDGPTNAVAALGRVSGSAATAASGDGWVARSGRSGNATALSVTGSGSATSSAASGSTGAVGATGPGADARSTGVRSRATTIDVEHVTSALRALVRDLGDEMGAVAGTDTTAHVAGLLAAARSGAAASEPVTVEVAAWDRSGESASDSIRCPAYDGSSTVPSCALAIAVTGGSGAQATVLPPRLSSATTASNAGVGAPGMATAISVAVSGTAVSSARTGDAGVRVPHGAPPESMTTSTVPSQSSSSAQSGDSGSSTAVALTVQGASATSARSGDTGSALSSVVPAAPRLPDTSAGAASAGAGGSATSTARSGDSGSSLAISNGGNGAVGQSRSGDTGDAAALAADGRSGRDWSEDLAGDSGRVVGGHGGDGRATATTGHSGATLSLVISGGSAVAAATSGTTGASVADSVGGAGGDTHTTGSGVDVVQTGDGGSATGSGRSGDTGAAISVLVTPYDGAATSRSGSSGGTSAYARGGGAGCASSGIDPDRACRPVESPLTEEPAPGAVTVDAPAGATSAPAGDERPATASGSSGAQFVAPPPAPDGAGRPVARVEAHSEGSADIRCVVHASHRECRSRDTRDVSSQVDRTGATSPSSSAGTPELGVVLAAAPAPAPAAEDPTPDGPRTEAARVSAVALLINAAVPFLALLSLVATFMTRRRRQALRSTQHVPKHRRKQSLPTSTSHRSR